jgi:hypothetical protein
VRNGGRWEGPLRWNPEAIEPNHDIVWQILRPSTPSDPPAPKAAACWPTLFRASHAQPNLRALHFLWAQRLIEECGGPLCPMENRLRRPLPRPARLTLFGSKPRELQSDLLQSLQHSLVCPAVWTIQMPVDVCVVHSFIFNGEKGQAAVRAKNLRMRIRDQNRGCFNPLCMSVQLWMIGFKARPAAVQNAFAICPFKSLKKSSSSNSRSTWLNKPSVPTSKTTQSPFGF